LPYDWGTSCAPCIAHPIKQGCHFWFGKCKSINQVIAHHQGKAQVLKVGLDNVLDTAISSPPQKLIMDVTVENHMATAM
jgi:hypothetical protein